MRPWPLHVSQNGAPGRFMSRHAPQQLGQMVKAIRFGGAVVRAAGFMIRLVSKVITQ